MELKKIYAFMDVYFISLFRFGMNAFAEFMQKMRCTQPYRLLFLFVIFESFHAL